MSSWSAVAPSNIALIKYMGKSDYEKNLATSPSLSLTLNHLLSLVRITKSDSASSDHWEKLLDKGSLEVLGKNLNSFERVKLDIDTFVSPTLSLYGQERFLKHWQECKEHFGIDGAFRVESANNFPADCGIASSASSFAALSLAAYDVAQTCGTKNLDLSIVELAKLSRKGSGSSCRSLFSPWCIWDGEYIGAPDFDSLELIHNVVLVSDGKKAVSSSEAHKRVATSALFEGRTKRATDRLGSLKKCFQGRIQDQWAKLFDICWAEFWDMHALFETSMPSFGYMSKGSIEVLNNIRNHWAKTGDGPLVTMDAGANVHLIYRGDQADVEFALKSKLSHYQIISSEAHLLGRG